MLALLAVSGASALVSPLWKAQPSLGVAPLAGSVRLAPRSAAAAVVLRGGARVPRAVASASAEAELRPEAALKPTAFLFVLSVAVCALVPPAHLVATMGSAGGTRAQTACAHPDPDPDPHPNASPAPAPTLPVALALAVVLPAQARPGCCLSSPRSRR